MRCEKTINSQKKNFERNNFAKNDNFAHAIAHTAHKDDKFKSFLLNNLIKHMVNASLCAVELWEDCILGGLPRSQQIEE